MAKYNSIYEGRLPNSMCNTLNSEKKSPNYLFNQSIYQFIISCKHYIFGLVIK